MGSMWIRAERPILLGTSNGRIRVSEASASGIRCYVNVNEKRLSDSSDNRFFGMGHREDALLGFARIIQRAWRRYRGRILPAA